HLDGVVWPLQERVATGQVVMGQGVVGPELHQTLVDLQPLLVAALQRQVIALHAQDIDIIRMTVKDLTEEIELKIKLGLIGRAGQGTAGGNGLRALVRVLALMCHAAFPLRKRMGPKERRPARLVSFLPHSGCDYKAPALQVQSISTLKRE